MSLTIRPACEDDEKALIALIKSERLNPLDLHWFNFIVAVADGRLIGAAQMRCHGDGSRELASLVVEASHRRRGLAAQLINALLDREPGRVFMITSRARAGYFARWGFAPVAIDNASARVKRNYRMGHYGGRVMSVLQRRSFNPLIILERPALWHQRREQFLDAQWF